MNSISGPKFDIEPYEEDYVAMHKKMNQIAFDAVKFIKEKIRESDRCIPLPALMDLVNLRVRWWNPARLK